MPDAVAGRVVARTLDGRRADASASALDVLDAAFEGSHGISLDFGDSASRLGSALDPREPFGQLIVEALDCGMEPKDWLALLREDGDPRVRRRLLQLFESEVLQTFAGRYRLWGVAKSRDEFLRHRCSLRVL